MAKKQKQGLTLMELIVVLALLAILAAVLVPLFLNTTDRARLRTDIQSARVIQNAIDLYRVETGRTLTGSVSDMMTTLGNAGYLNLRNNTIQTEGAEWESYNGAIRVNVTNSPQSVRDAVANLAENEREMVRGG